MWILFLGPPQAQDTCAQWGHCTACLAWQRWYTAVPGRHIWEPLEVVILYSSLYVMSHPQSSGSFSGWWLFATWRNLSWVDSHYRTMISNWAFRDRKFRNIWTEDTLTTIPLGHKLLHLCSSFWIRLWNSPTLPAHLWVWLAWAPTLA